MAKKDSLSFIAKAGLPVGKMGVISIPCPPDGNFNPAEFLYGNGRKLQIRPDLQKPDIFGNMFLHYSFLGRGIRYEISSDQLVGYYQVPKIGEAEIGGGEFIEKIGETIAESTLYDIAMLLQKKMFMTKEFNTKNIFFVRGSGYKLRAIVARWCLPNYPLREGWSLEEYETSNVESILSPDSRVFFHPLGLVGVKISMADYTGGC